ncbi:MAG: SDR family NAD(P)-dependent oxidoreductase [Hyphomicrobiales bacterium]|nr:SDR family NAD(P)-dependent oxidoreductase [Hyphomicrobiales bacterium]
MTYAHKQRAVVTGASTGIGYELAKLCIAEGYDLLIVANEPKIHEVAKTLGTLGRDVQALEADLATTEGVDALYDAAYADGRHIDALFANAGMGFGDGFLEQDFDGVKRTIDTNITCTLYLLHKVAADMRNRGHGRILITGSIAGFVPGPYQAVYASTKAFIDSFSYALRHELKDTGVTVTCLMPGVTQTEFFERAGMMDTKVGSAPKGDPADVARSGFDAMMRGEGSIVPGLLNKLTTAVAGIIPQGIAARIGAAVSKPESPKN